MFKLYDVSEAGLFPSSGVKRGEDPTGLGLLDTDSFNHWAVKEVRRCKQELKH
jgi:hypothetical protein